MDKKDYLLFSLTVLIFALFSILKNITGGIIWLALVVLVLFMVGFSRNGKARFFSNNEYFRRLMVFVIIGLLSNIWSINKSLSWEASTSILRTWIILNMIYCSVVNISSYNLFRSIMWGGTIFFMYIILTMGIGEIMLMSQLGERVGGDIFNANMMGMLAAAVVVICFSSYIYNGLSFDTISGVIGLFIVIITASRKAFIMLALGLLMVYFLKKEFKNVISFTFRIIGITLVSAVLIYLLFSLPMLSMYAERFSEFAGFFSDSADLTHSDWERKVLIEEGWQQFLKTPFTGLGLDCGRILAEPLVGHLFYLHNNFVELLADVGIFGFLSYYCIHFVFFKKMFRYYGQWSIESKLAFSIMTIYLVADWGYVSYYHKEVLFVMMVCYKSLYEMEHDVIDRIEPTN